MRLARYEVDQRSIRWGGSGDRVNAFCWGCDLRLATVGRVSGPGIEPRREAWLNAGLIPRPERHATGLARWGPPRRGQHGDARHAPVEMQSWQTWPGWTPSTEVYVNCPRCDRGQVVGPLDSGVLQFAHPVRSDPGHQ